MPKKGLEKLERAIVNCSNCSRLRKYCLEIAKTKKREFRDWDYWGKPVPGFGDAKARLWIVGLAPAAHGANRTGRVFTGDSSGNWLYRALHLAGFASQEKAWAADDGMILTDAFISAAVRCAPPDNKPLPEEIANCAPFLDKEYRLLKNAWLFLALGSIGFNASLKLMERNGVKIPRPRPRFGHGAFYDFGEKAILASYHPSRQNTNTGKLTVEMWDGIFKQAKTLIEDRVRKSSRG